MGYAAGDHVTTGAQNTFVGAIAGDANTTASYNSLFGYAAGQLIEDGGSNTAVGAHALDALTAGASNTAVGAHACGALTTASHNIGIGQNAQILSTTATQNITIGNYSGDSITTGSYNVILGTNSGVAVTTGASNVLLGQSAGDGITTGNYNVCVGQNAEPSAVDGTDQIIIGNLNQTGKGNSTGFIAASTGANYAGNNSASWSTTSDRRIKKNIVPSPKGLAEIKQLVPCNFNYKTTDEIREIFPESNEILPLDVLITSGIAQEVQVPFPEAVTERNDHGMLSVNNDPIVWAMVNAIKELSTENDKLKERLDALEA